MITEETRKKMSDSKNKKILAFNWNCILDDVLEELKKRGHTIIDSESKENLERWKDADVIIVWNETTLGGWQDWIIEARKMGKKVICMQHGRRGTSRFYPPFNEKSVSDLICVWSENDRKRLTTNGIDPEKIRVTGTTIFRHLKPKVPHKGFNVVYCPEHWDKDVAENFIVFDILKKIKGINLTVKTLKNEQMEEYYDNVVSSERGSPEHMEVVTNLLATTDLVVGISESTFELLAEAMDIPVVIADCWIPKACDGDERYKEYHREYSNACTMSSLKDLEKNVKLHLKHPELLREERKQIIINDGGTDIQNPLEEILKVICSK